MKHFLILCLWLLPVSLFSQKEDLPQTLQWAFQQAGKIEYKLQYVQLNGDHTQMVLTLFDVERDFDLILASGLYCTRARIAATHGKEAVNLFDNEPTDYNSCMLKLIEARENALLIQKYVTECLRSDTPRDTAISISVLDLVGEKIDNARNSITAGIESEDFHQLALQMEETENILKEVQLVVSSLNKCDQAISLNKLSLEHLNAAKKQSEWTAAVNMAYKLLEDLDGWYYLPACDLPKGISQK